MQKIATGHKSDIWLSEFFEETSLWKLILIFPNNICKTYFSVLVFFFGLYFDIFFDSFNIYNISFIRQSSNLCFWQKCLRILQNSALDTVLNILSFIIDYWEFRIKELSKIRDHLPW